MPRIVEERVSRQVKKDSCFLKDPWDGQLFCAVGRDANDQMYPVAWSVSQIEKKETWGWFLEHWEEDL